MLTRALSPVQAEDDEELPEIERERSAAEPRDDLMEPESELEPNAAFEQDFGGEPAAFTSSALDGKIVFWSPTEVSAAMANLGK